MIKQILSGLTGCLVLLAAAAEVPGRQSTSNEAALADLEAKLDQEGVRVRREIAENEQRRIAHNDPKNRPDPTDKAAVEHFNQKAAEGRAERIRLQARLANLERRRQQLADERAKQGARDVALNWLDGPKPPPDVEAALQEVFKDPAWPIAARQFLVKRPFVWAPGARSSPGIPDLPAAYDKARKALVIKPGFTQRNAAEKRDFIAFELGKLVRDRQTPEDLRRFDSEFAGYVVREVGQLPAAPDVLEKDAHAAFAYAYRHFLFDRAKLPNELVLWWLQTPPHRDQVETKGAP